MTDVLETSPTPLPPVCVAVVSIGRSGTSLVSRLLHELLDIDFGPATEHIGADASNPDGYFENREIMAFNERLLCSQGFSVAALPPLGFFEQIDLAQRRVWADEAVALLAKYTTNRPRFGFKDPRLSLDFPIWRDGTPDLVPIIMFRHPAAVAASAAAQMGIDAAAVIGLWRQYYQRVFADTRGMHRLIVSFERLLASPQSEFARLATHLSVPEQRYRAQASRLPTIIRPTQSRHHHLAAGTDSSAAMDAKTTALYAYLCDCAEANRAPDETQLARLTA